ncbi:hypothetical protein JX265_004006 [Neoarthrinium moseri]|uniref:cyclin-dependent kinase n=1 Tax=Neoarthrinium moseri TaxID=1658444 RepID=A0A9P9WRI0_9PEZI|nr:uncharacterized protein JN550_006759 [Neoarthrinium moseri]KAI1867952.1 hypothetical protein JN550_006759 [Neoarthrinium moseri]KAI1876480.1 hypothetical protein JX265_004006 [Neoarthrinium moseri]
MAYADRDHEPRSGHAYHRPAHSPHGSHRSHSRRAYERAGHGAMNRDDDDRRDRGRSDREPRGPPKASYDRRRSLSPAPRRAEPPRGRDYPRDTRRDGFRERDDIPKGPRRRSRSPTSPGKRRRSISPGPPYHGSKKSKRDRERDKRRVKKGRPRPSSPSYRRSPSPYRGRHASDRPDLFDFPPSRARSRSPRHPGESRLDRGASPHERPRRGSLLSNRSRSPPRPGSRHSGLSRVHSPHPPQLSEAGSYSRRSTPGPEAPLSHRPHSPQPDRPPPTGPSASRKKHREDPRLARRPQPSSGANSIEVGMNRRADVRSSYGPNTSAALHPPGRSSDPRHNYSPSHATSGSSHHGSPSAQSPHGERSRGASAFSPQRGSHSGPQSQFNQSPPHPPTGPSRGFSRGSFRGGSFSAPRGGSRNGGFNPPTGPSAERGHTSHSHSGESTPNHGPNLQQPETVALRKDDPVTQDPSQPEKEPPFDESMAKRIDDQDIDEQVPQPNRAPPSGPTTSTQSGPKFSFAFKATSKTPVAAPKPEISQKFSAAPPRRDPPQPADDRSNRDRDLPRDVPTGPASSRSRNDHEYHSRQRAPEHPRPARPPRTRKVIRIERRLKPKPTLPEHLAASESPFYRKPGNDSVVGSGTYGKVFKGVHVYSGRLVALKKIRMEGERDGFPVTAVREIKLLQSLRHENIVSLQEVMVERNDCFMVFEYLSHDLTGLLNHPSFKLEPDQKKHLAKQLFEGLDYLHTRGVLHRDIKAANILVSSDGILKLADFGLARFYAKHHQNDYTNRVITIWYRSPELLLGETRYSAAVDVWSAACVMVEIFTRHAIFPGDGTEINQLDKIYAILGTPNKVEWPDLVKMEWFELLRPGYRKPNVFAEKYMEKVPAAAFELLASMFQYDPVRRPSAAQALEHPYFTTEYPPPRQATELANIQGDWHEFESKALRREKERQEREARRAANSKAKDAEKPGKEVEVRDKERKRPGSSHDGRDTKRPHIEGRPSSSGKPSEGP